MHRQYVDHAFAKVHKIRNNNVTRTSTFCEENMEVFKNAFVTRSRMSGLVCTVEYQQRECVSVRTKQRLVSLLTRMKTLRAIVRGLYARSTAPKVVWVDIETAFEKRLLINVGAVDPQRFFQNARRTVISRISVAITEQRIPACS